MAMTIDQLQALMKGEGFRFYVDPSRPVILSGGTGHFGQYQFIIALEVEGRFLQFRTQRYLTCPPESPHLFATLKVLADLDYSLRFIKFAWDPSDGEIVAYGDIWLADGTMTQGQFSRCLGGFLSAVDMSAPRLSKTVADGKDPGPVNSDSPTGPSDAVASRLREMLDRALGRPGSGPAPEAGGGVTAI